MIKLELVLLGQGNMSSNRYDVTTDRKNILDFINEVVSDEREWGEIRIYPNINSDWYKDAICTMEYKHGERFGFWFKNDEYRKTILDGNMDDIVCKIISDGAWSRMDYSIYLKGD